jgi:hypothetical protein
MAFTNKFFYYWYDLRKNYHQALYDSCLDDKIKAGLKNKINFYKNKVEHIKSVMKEKEFHF